MNPHQKQLEQGERNLPLTADNATNSCPIGYTGRKVKKMAYNGWTNYQTFRIAVDIDCDECEQKYWNNRAKELYAIPDEDFIDIQALLASELKEYYNPHIWDIEDLPEVYKEILNSALEDINWLEIARSLLIG